MKHILVTSLIIVSSHFLYAQIPLAEIEGRISIYLPEDSTSVHIGKNAGVNQMEGIRNNTFMGTDAGLNNTSGDFNSIFGSNAGETNNTGFANSFFGGDSGMKNNSGSSNSFFGYCSGSQNTTGFDNSFFGYFAGNSIRQGNNNISLGADSGPIASDSSQSHRLYIDVMKTSNPLIYGEFDNDLIRVNGELETEDGSVFMRNLGSTDTDQGIKWGEGADLPIFGLVYDGVGSGSESRLHVREYNGTDTDILTLKADGKIGIGTDNPQFKSVIKSTENAITGAGTAVDISNLATVFSKEENINNEAIGIGFQSSSDLTTVGGAIIFERTGAASMGSLHFATKESTSADDDIPIRMTIRETGNVGIGITNPQHILDVAGTTRSVDIICGATLLCSDERYKKDFTSFENPLNLIGALNGYFHYWRNDEFPEWQFSTERQIGFKAQEVIEILPEIVSIMPDGYMAVEYNKVVPVLVEAIKEQQAMIENLKSQIENRDQQYTAILSRIEQLENERKAGD